MEPAAFLTSCEAAQKCSPDRKAWGKAATDQPEGA